jgi:hypothetical protein
MPPSIALGDVDGDGKVDLALMYRSNTTSPLLIAVFLNNGSGTAGGFFGTQGFTVQPAVSAGASQLPSLALGDVDGDGRVDLAILLQQGSSSPFTASVFLNNGSGSQGKFFATQVAATFQPTLSSSTFSDPPTLALGDLDGTGLVDAAIMFRESASAPIMLPVFVNNGMGVTGRFFSTQAGVTFQPQVAMPLQPPTMALGDVDGDGKADLALLVEPNAGQLTAPIFLNSGQGAAGKFFAAQPAITFQPPSTGGLTLPRIALGDVNGDGKADIAIADQQSSSAQAMVQIFLNTSH